MNIHHSLARHGVEEWYQQRASAMLLLFLLPIALWLVMAIYHGELNQHAVQLLLASMPARLFHSLFTLSLLLHAYIGLKVIMEDYLHCAMLRTWILAAMQILFVGFMFFWLAQIWL